MTLKTIFIFTLGFIAGIAATMALTNHINAEVASKLDDVKVLQQAGYDAPFYADSTEATRWND